MAIGTARYLISRLPFDDARLPDDQDLLARARELARDVVAADPALERPANAALHQRAVARYPRAVELFRVG